MPRAVTLLPGGTVFSGRAAQEVRRQGRGRPYAERRLISLGARPPPAGQHPADGLARALAEAGARKIRHPGSHRHIEPGRVSDGYEGMR